MYHSTVQNFTSYIDSNPKIKDVTLFGNKLYVSFTKDRKIDMGITIPNASKIYGRVYKVEDMELNLSGRMLKRETINNLTALARSGKVKIRSYLPQQSLFDELNQPIVDKPVTPSTDSKVEFTKTVIDALKEIVSPLNSDMILELIREIAIELKNTKLIKKTFHDEEEFIHWLISKKLI